MPESLCFSHQLIMRINLGCNVWTTLDKYGHLISEVNTEQANKLDTMLGFKEQSGALSGKGRQRVDIGIFNEKKDSENVSKSLIINGSGDRI